MRQLTTEQRHLYQEQGFVRVPGVFPEVELDAIDREIDRLLPEAEDRSGRKPGWMHQLGQRSEVMQAFAEDERTLTLIEDIVRPGIAIHTAKLVAKPPHYAEVCHWHQDEAFYLKPDDPATRSATRMSVWVPLQDADERNGCLWVVPGSHQWGLEDYHLAESGQCIRVIDREAYANEHAIPVPVIAGDVVLFSAWLWHHSKGNQTDRVRRAFIISYQEATVMRGGGQEWKILRPAPAELVDARR